MANYQPGQKRALGKGLAAAAAVFAVLLAAVGILLHTADQQRVVPQSAETAASDEVEINGIACKPRKNLKTYLFMGIDNSAETGENYVIGGLCDVLELLVVDRTHKTYTRLPINRNTMTQVHSYDEEGEDLGTTVCQISYAHMSGDAGGPLSCENTVRAVSEYLYGQKIDGYVALNMEAIPVVNHLAGGVTVTIEDDFSDSDPSLELGETIRLSDEQAMHYVHDRMNVGDGTNEGRMRRQSRYIEGLKDTMAQKLTADESYSLQVYRTLEDYMVTDLTDKEFSRIANALLECESRGVLEIEGEIGEDEFEFATFTPDADSLAETVIDLFYNRTEGEASVEND